MEKGEERGGAKRIYYPVTQPPVNKLEKWGVNRITKLVMFVGSLFTFWTFNESEVGMAVAGIFAFGGFATTVYEKAKGGIKIGWAAWLRNPNTWADFSAILAWALPFLSPDAARYLQEIVSGILAGNWQQAITATFSLIAILFFTFRPKAPAADK